MPSYAFFLKRSQPLPNSFVPLFAFCTPFCASQSNIHLFDPFDKSVNLFI